MNKRGVAILSVVVVLVIMSILTGTVIYNFNKNVKKIELREYANELKVVEDFFRSYVEENDEYGVSKTIAVDITQNPKPNPVAFAFFNKNQRAI